MRFSNSSFVSGFIFFALRLKRVALAAMRVGLMLCANPRYIPSGEAVEALAWAPSAQPLAVSSGNAIGRGTVAGRTLATAFLPRSSRHIACKASVVLSSRNNSHCGFIVPHHAWKVNSRHSVRVPTIEEFLRVCYENVVCFLRRKRERAMSRFANRAPRRARKKRGAGAPPAAGQLVHHSTRWNC
jgi:hypothetical protein